MAERTRLRVLIAGFLVVAAALAIFGPLLATPFFGDDYGLGLLEQIDDERGLAFARSFHTPWGGLNKTRYYRPVDSLLSYWLMRGFGLDPLALRAANLIAHVLVAVTLIILLSASLGRVGWTCIAAGVFFVVNPASSDVVMSIATRMNAVCALFVLSALILVVRFAKTGSVIALALSAGSGILAFGTKETAVTLPCSLLAALIVAPQADRRRYALACAAHGAVFVLYLVARNHALGATGTDAFVERVVYGFDPRNLWSGVKLMLAPIIPASYGPIGFACVGLCFVAWIVVVCLRLRERRGAVLVAFGIPMLVMPLLITAHFPIAMQADTYFGVTRFLYLPIAGLCLVAFSGFVDNRSGRWAAGGALVLALFSVYSSRWAAANQARTAIEAEHLASAVRRRAGDEAPRWLAVRLPGARGVADYGAWLGLAMQPPFVKRPVHRVLPIGHLAPYELVGVAMALREVDAAMVAWDSAARRLRTIDFGETRLPERTTCLELSIESDPDGVPRRVRLHAAQVGTEHIAVRVATPALVARELRTATADGVIELSEAVRDVIRWISAARRRPFDILLWVETARDCTIRSTTRTLRVRVAPKPALLTDLAPDRRSGCRLNARAATGRGVPPLRSECETSSTRPHTAPRAPARSRHLRSPRRFDRSGRSHTLWKARPS